MSWETKPYWTESLLQGLAFWIGYKTQLYRDYPLTEGAIVGEAVSLLKGCLKDDYKLECEIMYKKLKVDISSQERADLIIKKNEVVDTVIEVKRANAQQRKITEDFERLARFQKNNIHCRCFVLLVSQKYRPKKYINENGNAITKLIKTKDYIAKARRACKAATSFKEKSSAHYSCLIEVISNDKYDSQ